MAVLNNIEIFTLYVIYVKVRYYHFEVFRMLIYGVENSRHSVALLPIDKSIINTHRASLSYHYMTDAR